MSSKSKLGRLQCKTKSVPTTTTKETEIIETKKSLNTTPINRRSYPKDDTDDENNTSPFVLRFTQDSCDDDMDVIWDWDSPKSHGNRAHIHRKRILHSSPNIPRKHVTTNEKTLPKFNSLKLELEQLANCFQANNTTNTNDDIFVKPKTPEIQSPEDDLFEGDDMLDEEMFKCSQQIEEQINIQKFCTSVLTNNNLTKLNADTTIQDDSFDCFLEEIKDDEIELFSQQSNNSSEFDLPTQPLVIEKPYVPLKPGVSSPRSIARTNSVPAEFLSKLLTTPSTSSTSFQRTKSDDFITAKKLQCSPEEIEKKRLEAKAKLEFKRKEKEIEKKRLEALERLKRNRMQRMMTMSGTTKHFTLQKR